MKNELVLIRSNGKDHLCHKCSSFYEDICNPIIAFSEDENDFEIISPDKSYINKIYEYLGHKVYIVPIFYLNQKLGIFLEDITDGSLFTELTVNFEEQDVLGLSKHIFIDINNNPDAMNFLESNGLAKDSGHSYRSGWVNYPLAILNIR